MRWVRPPYSLAAQVALLVVVVAIVASVAAANLPNYFYDLRDHLFLLTLEPADRTALQATRSEFGGCSREFFALRNSLGFDGWRFQSEYALAFVATVTAIIMGWISVRLARRVTLPIRNLAEHVRAVAGGLRTQPPSMPPGASTELLALRQDISSMTIALAAADQDLRLRSAAIAHDIRTPLAIIRGRLVGLQEGVFDLDEEFLVGLFQQVSLLDDLVSDINALTDAGHAASGQRERVDLVPLIRETGVAQQTEIESLGGKLHLTLPSTAIEVMADPLRLRRALVNILHNASRYAAGSNVEIKLTANKNQAVVVVADDGPGWPPGDLAGLLEPFARGEASRSRESGGTGLGLAIVEAIVRAYDGDVRLFHASDGGAGVELCLPLASS